MQKNRNTQSQAAVSGFQVASSAGNALPPTNYVDALLAELFPESESDNDVFAPFDYEGFLRKEGLV